MSDLHVDGMGVSAGVVETIVAIATQEVDGVASVGSAKISGLRGMISNKAVSYTHLTLPTICSV